MNKRLTKADQDTALAASYRERRRNWIVFISGIYLVLAGVFATTTLDIDEFTFVREPYELLGGDYAMDYLRSHDYADAFRTAIKAYAFFWNYRPLNAPVISQKDRATFAVEEKRFGYVQPDAVKFDDPNAVQKYGGRLVVPEPNRFYSHGAGKPLLPAILSIPQLALLKALHVSSDRFLRAQYSGRPNWVFLILRLAQLLAGLASVVLVFRILEKNLDLQRACLGTLIFAAFPVSIKYFPNLHHDSILVPFFVLAIDFYVRRRYVPAGVAYGLALASKNLAIILAPALLLRIVFAVFAVWRQGNVTAARVLLRQKIAGLIFMSVVAFATFLPFANPVSYTEEILTPVISRPVDPRGENVSQWTIKAMASGFSPLSVQLNIAQKFLFFRDLGFMFFVLALGLALQRPLTEWGKISLMILVLYLPMSSIFGSQLTYRTLLLVPFFCMAAAELLQPKQLRLLVGATFALALVYLSDPGRTDLIHNNQNAARQAK